VLEQLRQRSIVILRRILHLLAQLLGVLPWNPVGIWPRRPYRAVLPRAQADVFALALEGLWIDAPSVAVLRARIQILSQEFAR
jgi:hypothetical protein